MELNSRFYKQTMHFDVIYIFHDFTILLAPLATICVSSLYCCCWLAAVRIQFNWVINRKCQPGRGEWVESFDKCYKLFVMKVIFYVNEKCNIFHVKFSTINFDTKISFSLFFAPAGMFCVCWLMKAHLQFYTVFTSLLRARRALRTARAL